MSKSAEQIDIADYDYPLPEEKIARYPLAERGASRQLVYRNGELEDGRFAELPRRLPAGTLLVGNHTRVVHARLRFPLGPGKNPVEIFCLDPVEPHDHALSLAATHSVVWKCLVGGNRRWKKGPLRLAIRQGLHLIAERLERVDNAFTIRFRWESGRIMSFGEMLQEAGSIPLPPYLNRAAEAADRERYQTIFATREGSVAAPTAGLHFTPEILEKLNTGGVDWATVTLHVGAGTFKPVTSPTLGGHRMHEEFFSVNRDFLHRLSAQYAAGRAVVSVGTTSLRCLESLHYLGASLLAGEAPDLGKPQRIGQWVATDERLTGYSPAETYRTLLNAVDNSKVNCVSGHTALLLSPATRVKSIDALITNFHQPRSTLLLLVAALVGEDWRKIYDHALASDYRFLSYGDSSLLWKRSSGA